MQYILISEKMFTTKYLKSLHIFSSLKWTDKFQHQMCIYKMQIRFLEYNVNLFRRKHARSSSLVYNRNQLYYLLILDHVSIVTNQNQGLQPC